MKDFKTPVAMKVTFKEYERDLKEPLSAIGYIGGLYTKEKNIKNAEYLLTDFASENKEIGFNERTDGNYLVDNYNLELFLALSAMTEGEVPIIGEWMWHYPDETPFQVKYFGYANSSPTGGINVSNPTGCGQFRKATKEELISHFTKPTVKKAEKIEYKVGDWVFGEFFGNTQYNEERRPVQILSIQGSNFGYKRNVGTKTNNASSFEYPLSTITRLAKTDEIEFDDGYIDVLPKVMNIDKPTFKEVCAMYPIGTTYKNVRGKGTIHTVDETFKFLSWSEGNISISNHGWILYEGEYAEIIEDEVEESTSEKWSVGTYLVIKEDNYLGPNHCLDYEDKIPVGHIGKIKYKSYKSTTSIEDNPVGGWLIEKSMCEWFATKEEAENYRQSIMKNTETPADWYIKCARDNFELCKKFQKHQRDFDSDTIIPGTILLSKHRYDKSYFFNNTKLPDFYKAYIEITTEQLKSIMQSEVTNYFTNLAGNSNIEIKESVKKVAPLHTIESYVKNKKKIRKKVLDLTSKHTKKVNV